MDTTPTNNHTIILIPNNGMGIADTEQQQKLIQKYLLLLEETDPLPSSICFYTEGVKLTLENSPVLDELRHLEAKGVRLLICMTCLKTYNVFEQVAVGTISSMPDIIKAQWQADKVITL
jgi:hypothetical protein